MFLLGRGLEECRKLAGILVGSATSVAAQAAVQYAVEVLGSFALV
jgi:hypothetical protein